MTENSGQHDELLSVSVKGLFGQHNHTINLKPNGMTLIHGPNGVGKTSVLKLIGHALRLDVNQLARTVFDSLELSFSGSRKLAIRRIPAAATSKQERLFDVPDAGSHDDYVKRMSFSFYGNTIAPVEWTVESESSRDPKRGKARQIAEVEERRPWLSRVGHDEWLDQRTGRLFSASDLLEEHAFILGRKDNARLEELKECLPKIPVSSIESQRLVITRPTVDERHPHRANSNYTNAVLLHAEGMSEKIQSTFHTSANVSQNMDRTFAHRVLTSKEAIQQSEGELRAKYNKQLGTWQRIKDAGLSPEGELRRMPRMYRFPQAQALDQLRLPEQLDETQQRVLSFYIEDTEQKLSPYQDLLEKVELFLTIVNSRFAYSGKELCCHASEGFRVQTQSGRRVPLEALSSGEQHEVVLNYQLIFGVPDNSLVLIDEPEISLHVDWQREFIDQILRIGEVRGHKFIIATHSPQIIDEHWEYTEVLKGAHDETEGDNER